MTTRGAGGERGRFIDCQRIGFSDIVQDSGRAERTRECRAQDFGCRCVGIAGGVIGRERFAGAGITGEFEPGIAGLDRRGHGLNGSTSDTGVWNLGLRYGLILTGPRGPGFLKGQLEYAFDVVPAWC